MRIPTALLLAAGLVLALLPVARAPARLAEGATPVAAAEVSARSPELRAFMDTYLAALHRRYPEDVGPAIGSDKYNNLLTDNSAGAIAEWDDRVRAWRDELAAMDRSTFTEEDQLDADLLLYQFDVQLEAATLKRWQMPVNALDGPQVWLPQMGDRVPLNKPRHYDDWVDRLKQVPTAIGDAIDNMRLGMEAGRVPPRVVVEPAVAEALAQTDSAYRADPTTSPFFAPLNKLPAGDPRRAEAADIIANRVIPAYEELALFLSNEYLPACRETTAIADSVDGVRAYDLALREQTTLELTADGVHELGLREVARIKTEMMGVIARTDWDGNTKEWPSADTKFAAFVHYLRTDPRFYFTDPDDLLRSYRALAKTIDPELIRLFGHLPRLPYGVRPLPLFAAKTAPAAFYYPGSFDSGIPAYFMVNTYALDQRPKYDMVALTLHEAVPGHHLQIAIAQELDTVHPLRKLGSYTAYTEGWALYAESLGLEMGEDTIDDGADHGLYADPYDDFGRLNFEIWRAMRLVVDTGLHTKGWTRQQAIDYMLANSANTELDTTSEVDRYIAWPGQATAYKIGELKIRELRARAEQALADRFDLRAFHDAILDAGPLPLPVLEKKIDRWIAAQRNAG